MLGVVKPRWHPQIPTPSRSHRSQTEKPSPNSYAQPPPPRSNGDSISNPLHSEHLSVAKPRWQPQIPTLTAPQRRQMETTPPNPYTQPPSPQPNGEATPKRPRSQPSPQPYAGALPKWLRSPTPSASNRRNHRQLSTLTNPPAQTDGNDSPKSLHSAALSVANWRSRTQIATPATVRRG